MDCITKYDDKISINQTKRTHLFTSGEDRDWWVDWWVKRFDEMMFDALNKVSKKGGECMPCGSKGKGKKKGGRKGK